MPPYSRLCAALLAFAPVAAQAHGPASEDFTNPAVEARGPEAPEGAASAVIDVFKLWPAPRRLKFCFFEGSDEAKAFFIETASQWDDLAAGLEFDYGPEGAPRACAETAAHIRVSFDNSGHWSYVGRDSLGVDASKATLNIAQIPSNFASLEDEDLSYLRGVILHEVGHALAMEHEHQSPAQNCNEEIDWDKAVSYFAASGWDREKTRRNLYAFTDTERFRFSEFDSESVMLYALPSSILKNGRNSPCYHRRNDTLSTSDQEMIRRMYPESRDDQLGYIEELQGKAAVFAKTLEPAQRSQIEEGVNDALAPVFKRELGNFNIGAISRINIGEISGRGNVIGSEAENLTTGDASDIIDVNANTIYGGVNTGDDNSTTTIEPGATYIDRVNGGSGPQYIGGVHTTASGNGIAISAGDNPNINIDNRENSSDTDVRLGNVGGDANIDASREGCESVDGDTNIEGGDVTGNATVNASRRDNCPPPANNQDEE